MTIPNAKLIAELAREKFEDHGLLNRYGRLLYSSVQTLQKGDCYLLELNPAVSQTILTKHYVSMSVLFTTKPNRSSE